MEKQIVSKSIGSTITRIMMMIMAVMIPMMIITLMMMMMMILHCLGHWDASPGLDFSLKGKWGSFGPIETSIRRIWCKWWWMIVGDEDDDDFVENDNWWWWYWWCQWQCCECSVCEKRHTDFGGLNTQSSLRHSSNIFNAVSRYLEWPQCWALSHHVDILKGKIGIVLLPQMNLCPRLCATGIVNNLHSWSFQFNWVTLGQQGQLRKLGHS